MSRYIDVDAVTKEPWFVEFRGDTIDDIAEQIIKACKHIVKTAPTIDIVRCRECRYKDMELCAMYKLVVAGVRKYDDYCSYGERRTDE